jgi:hypothetical protein
VQGTERREDNREIRVKVRQEGRDDRLVPCRQALLAQAVAAFWPACTPCPRQHLLQESAVEGWQWYIVHETRAHDKRAPTLGVPIVLHKSRPELGSQLQGVMR